MASNKKRNRRPEGFSDPAESTAAEREETRLALVTPLGILTPGGEPMVRVQFTIPQHQTIALCTKGKGNAKPLEVDWADASPAGILKVWGYGAGRYFKDGAAKRHPSTTDPDGNVVEGDAFTRAEKDAALEANAHKKWEGVCSGNIVSRTSGGEDPRAKYLRGFLVDALCQRFKDSEGKRYTAKTVPSAIARSGQTPDAIAAAAVACGMPDRMVEAFRTLANNKAEQDEAAALALQGGADDVVAEAERTGVILRKRA